MKPFVASAGVKRRKRAAKVNSDRPLDVRPQQPDLTKSQNEGAIGRRALLRGAVAAAGIASFPGPAKFASARTASSTGIELEPRMTTPGRGVGSSPYGMPSRFEPHVVRRATEHAPTPLSSWSFTPLDRSTGIITPNGLVYERHHAGIPEIDPDQHRLAIHGLVDRPLVMTLDDILRLPAVSQIRFLECAGNGYTEVLSMPRSKTAQFSHGLLSCCEWTGVPLRTVHASRAFSLAALIVTDQSSSCHGSRCSSSAFPLAHANHLRNIATSRAALARIAQRSRAAFDS